MTLTQFEGNELADRIEQWLGHVRRPQSGQIADFINDLRAAQNVNQWAGADFDRILPLVYRRERLVSILAFLRAVLLFLPLLLTWLAVNTASREFSRLARAAGPNEQVSFLLVWQGLGGMSKLSTVALLDVVIFAIMVLFTVRIGWAESAGKSAEVTEQMHQDLMIALERGLNGYRYLTIADINTAVQGTVQSLLMTSQRIGTAADALANSATAAFDAVQQVQQITAGTFSPLVGQLDSTVNSLGAAAQGHLAMVDLVNDARGQLAGQLGSTQASLAAVAQRVDQAAQAMIAQLESRLVAATDAIASSALAVSQSLNSQVGSMQNGFGDVLHRVDQAAQQMTAAIAGKLDSAATALAGTANHVATDLARETANQLSGVGATVTRAANDLQSSFGQVAQTVGESTEDFERTLRAVAYIFQNIKNDLDEINRATKQNGQR